MKEALIGIAGLGTVGKGTLDLLTANKVKIETGLDVIIKVKYIIFKKVIFFITFII